MGMPRGRRTARPAPQHLYEELDLFELSVDDVVRTGARTASGTGIRRAAITIARVRLAPIGLSLLALGVHGLADLLDRRGKVVVGALDGVRVVTGNCVTNRLHLGLDIGSQLRGHLVASVRERLLGLVGELVGTVSGLD